jgi:hypothetical protein
LPIDVVVVIVAVVVENTNFDAIKCSNMLAVLATPADASLSLLLENNQENLTKNQEKCSSALLSSR